MERGRPRGTFRAKQLSPKAKIALRAVVNGMAHKEAAQVADIHPVYVSQLKNSPEGQVFIGEINELLNNKSVEASQLMDSLGREAIKRLALLMMSSPSENIQLRAAQDLADRSNQYQKVQRHQVESFTLSGKDAREIAESMVTAASVKARFSDAAQGDYIKIPIEIPHGEGRVDGE